MPTLIDNLNQIESIKTDIRSAIQYKGVDMTGASFIDYPSKIGEIQTGGTFVTETLSVSINGTYTPVSGVDGYSQVTVSVPQTVGYTLNQIIDGNLPGATSINSTVQYFLTAGCWGTVETVNLPNCEFITDYAFTSDYNLTYVSAPVCWGIGSGVFYNCTSLTEAYLPNINNVVDYTFTGCQRLASVDVHACQTIGLQCFVNCFALSQISLPNCTSIADFGLYRTGLTSIDLPKCTYIGSSAFYRCASMSQGSFPEVVSIRENGFRQAGLGTVSLPKCTYIGYTVFAFCNSLNQVYIPRVMTLEAQAFYSCRNLTSLTINTDWYYIPRYADQLQGTAIASGNGSIYVDATMYNYWKTAQGWSQFATRFVSVGDATTPMLSLSDGLLYGKTKIMGDINNTGILNPNQITTVSLASCELVLESAFQYNGNITSVDLPVCTHINDFAFFNNASLTSISLPMCKYVGYCGLATMPISSLSLPACEYLGEAAIDGCYNLTEIYLGPCSMIGNYCIRQLQNLSKFTINYSGVCQIDTQRNTFYPITSIYVPSEWVSAYKADQNWAVYASQIFPIE